MAKRRVSRKGSLVVVGTGIKVAAHTTLESMTAIKEADQVFYLVTEAASESWLRQLNPNAATLDDLYAEGKRRVTTYRQMSGRIVAAVRQGRRVCAAFYGHPGVFVNASHHAMKTLARCGYDVRMLPGISAEDCLFADLGVNPGEYGCQSFEATDFLAARRRFDPRTDLILWQVGALGESSVRKGAKVKPERLKVLTKTLSRYYPASHKIVLYEAATFPLCDPSIRRIPLQRLARVDVRPMATVYIPPLPQTVPDPKISRWYEETA